ncbi:branched-chain amino acid ABC transporter permease [Nigerium massiliense]|uniref:branched-chain amino acid ABC transporter permease n=1 Tax=Nigerium massiliense TaxID=1522317 RepID=UPI0006943CAD|nr:branched-chain amino acid ABC transporter permease [Nigerium massiliense]
MKKGLVSFLVKAVPLLAAWAIVLVLINAGIVTDYYLATMATICINIVLAVSLNLITGFTGQFSLGHAGFMAIGAYTCAMVTMAEPSVLGFVGGLLGGGVLAALVGLLVGLPTLRLRGDYLAIATLGMAEIIRIILLNQDATNGAAGLSGIPAFLDWNWMFFLTVATVWIIANFLHSSQGRACISVREDEIAAESIGVHTVRSKVLAFMIGAFFAGIAGGMYASYFYFIKPDLFGFLKSVDILVIVVLGGLGSLSGSIIAAILLALISTALQPFPELRMIIYSLALVVIMIFRPQGLMGSREVSLGVLNRFRRREPAVATASAAPAIRRDDDEEVV